MIYLLVLLCPSCTEHPMKKITSPETYDKAMPFSQAEIKKAERDQESICAEYSSKSKIRSKRMLAIDASLEDEALTKTQKLQKNHALVNHINDDFEGLKELKTQCEVRIEKLEEMYKKNQLAGDQYLEQRKRK